MVGPPSDLDSHSINASPFNTVSGGYGGGFTGSESLSNSLINGMGGE